MAKTWFSMIVRPEDADEALRAKELEAVTQNETITSESVNMVLYGEKRTATEFVTRVLITGCYEPPPIQ